jgi:hypothetical protein
MEVMGKLFLLKIKFYNLQGGEKFWVLFVDNGNVSVLYFYSSDRSQLVGRLPI